MLELNENNLPLSPMKKLKILSENQNVHNHVTKFEPESELKTKTTVLTSTTTTTTNDENNYELTDYEKEEPLLIETTGQYVIFPIQYDDMWHMYKTFVENFWSASENIEHLEALNFTDSEMEFIREATAFFSSFNSFGLVIENFAEDFSKIIQITEAKFFYGHQLFIQDIHFEMYNRLIGTMIKDETERNKFYDDIESLEGVKGKRKWVKGWYENNYTFAEKMVASACLYGLFFTVINIIQDWFKTRALKQPLNHELIEIIDRMTVDFDLERDFACLMLHHLKRKPPMEFIKKTIDEAVRVEKQFLLKGLKLNLINVSENDVNKLLDSRATSLKNKISKAYETNKKHLTLSNDNTQTENQINSTDSTTTTTSTGTLPRTPSTVTTPIDKNIRFDEDF